MSQDQSTRKLYFCGVFSESFCTELTSLFELSASFSDSPLNLLPQDYIMSKLKYSERAINFVLSHMCGQTSLKFPRSMRWSCVRIRIRILFSSREKLERKEESVPHFWTVLKTICLLLNAVYNSFLKLQTRKWKWTMLDCVRRFNFTFTRYLRLIVKILCYKTTCSGKKFSDPKMKNVGKFSKN